MGSKVLSATVLAPNLCSTQETQMLNWVLMHEPLKQKMYVGQLSNASVDVPACVWSSYSPTQARFERRQCSRPRAWTFVIQPINSVLFRRVLTDRQWNASEEQIPECPEMHMVLSLTLPSHHPGQSMGFGAISSGHQGFWSNTRKRWLILHSISLVVCQRNTVKVSGVALQQNLIKQSKYPAWYISCR